MGVVLSKLEEKYGDSGFARMTTQLLSGVATLVFERCSDSSF